MTLDVDGTCGGGNGKAAAFFGFPVNGIEIINV
jgi:hypothetical protein